VACANQRCDQENVIEQLKNGVGALRVPLYDLVSNWAYMVIAALAWNLKSWFAMMLHRKTDRRETTSPWSSAGSSTPSSSSPPWSSAGPGSITIRLIGWQPTIDRMFSAWRTIERTGFT
jgi:hypothetical protein